MAYTAGQNEVRLALLSKGDLCQHSEVLPTV